MIDYFKKFDTKQTEQFAAFYQFLIQQNKFMNLTAITEEREVYIKHFYDSLLIEQVIDLNTISTICDIGSGAGFPGIPLKIAYPHLQLTIIEPTKKRVNFLTELVTLLQLDGVTIINGRAEDEVNNYRDSFDIVTARAVAKLNVLLELCFGYAKVGGVFIALKGINVAEEIDQSKRASELLHAELSQVAEFTLPENLGSRALLIYKKTKQSSRKYPRHFSKIKNNPL